MQRAVLLAVVVLGLGACSSTTFLYNRLDFILPWYLGRYVDLDAPQADWFDGRIEAVLAWHRCRELPRYVEILETLEADLETPASLEVLQARTDTLEDAWYRLRDPALEELLDLGARLDEEQIDEFLGSLRKRQAKYERKYLRRSEEEFREDATDNLQDLLSDYLGRLTAQQRAQVEETVAELTRSDSIWLDERRAWIDAMERLLRREEGWQDRIRATIYSWEDELDGDALAVYDRNTLLVQVMFVDVLNARSERQDRRLRRRLTDLREDLLLLHEDTPAGACPQLR